MNVYISGISGTGMGPLALMAKAAGFAVWGSDLAKGAIYDELIKAGIEVKIGPQDGEFLREKLEWIGLCTLRRCRQTIKNWCWRVKWE